MTQSIHTKQSKCIKQSECMTQSKSESTGQPLTWGFACLTHRLEQPMAHDAAIKLSLSIVNYPHPDDVQLAIWLVCCSQRPAWGLPLLGGQ